MPGRLFQIPFPVSIRQQAAVVDIRVIRRVCIWGVHITHRLSLLVSFQPSRFPAPSAGQISLPADLRITSAGVRSLSPLHMVIIGHGFSPAISDHFPIIIQDIEARILVKLLLRLVNGVFFISLCSSHIMHLPLHSLRNLLLSFLTGKDLHSCDSDTDIRPQYGCQSRV